MSATQSAHEHMPQEENLQFGSDHGTVKSYIVGFLISLVLSVIPFTIVMKDMFTDRIQLITVAISAVVQLLIQLIFFLHLSTHSKARWNLTVFIFTLVVVLILVIGSLWIMLSLNYYMVN